MASKSPVIIFCFLDFSLANSQLQTKTLKSNKLFQLLYVNGAVKYCIILSKGSDQIEAAFRL